MKILIAISCILFAACSSTTEPSRSDNATGVTGTWIECDGNSLHQVLVFSLPLSCIINTEHGSQNTVGSSSGDTSYVLSWSIPNPNGGPQEWNMSLSLRGDSLLGSESRTFYLGGTKREAWPVAFSRQ